MDRFDLQDSEYSFPYHHVPSVDVSGRVTMVRAAKWGYGYLCLLLHVREHLRRINPASLLDVGCGDGRFTKLMAEEIERVKGVDLSTRAIAHASALAPHVDFAAMNAADLDETFDSVVAIETLEHIPDDAVSGFLQSLAARLNPGGHLILTVPSNNKPVAPKHYRHYTTALLEQQVRSAGTGLETVTLEYVNRIFLPVRVLLALHYNPLWTLEVRPMAALFWRYYWAKMRHASQRDGTNVVGVFRKSAE